MTNFIPIFPLSIVVYPGEDLNLHIFEPRYKQMINECHAESKPFGIPSVIDNRLQDYGTLMEITEISSVHENGEMDIKTKGQKVFRILEVIKDVPDKLFGGAIVNYPYNYEQVNLDVMRLMVNSIKELHKHLKIIKKFKSNEELKSYDLAHHLNDIIYNQFFMYYIFVPVYNCFVEQFNSCTKPPLPPFY